MHNFVEDRSYSVLVIKEQQRFWKRILIVDDNTDVTITLPLVILQMFQGDSYLRF